MLRLLDLLICSKARTKSVAQAAFLGRLACEHHAQQVMSGGRGQERLRQERLRTRDFVQEGTGVFSCEISVGADADVGGRSVDRVQHAAFVDNKKMSL